MSGYGGSGGIGGSTGATDNAILRADGTGGGSVQSSLAIVTDTGAVQGIGTFSLSDPGLTFTGLSNALGFAQSGSGSIYAVYNGTASMSLSFVNAAIVIPSTYQFSLSASDPSSTGGGDVGFARLAAAVGKITNGSSGLGFLQHAGQSRVAADVTNTTTTMAAITGLSATVVSGRHYTGRLIVFCSNSVAADGLKFDFDGGSAAMTSFRAHGTLFDTALLLSSQTTALATDFVAATVTGSAVFECHFGFTPSGNGTFIPRFAENATTTGTATATRNSYMILDDTP